MAILIILALILIASIFAGYGWLMLGTVVAIPVSYMLGGAIDEFNYIPAKMDAINMKGKVTVAGPITMRVMESTKHNKRVIMFGDFHQVEILTCDSESSIYVPEYIKWILKQNSNVYFDLFHEYRYNTLTKKYDRGGDSGVLENYYRTFQNCLTDLQNRSACQTDYPNARFHLADTRTSHTSDYYEKNTTTKKLFELMAISTTEALIDDAVGKISSFNEKVKTGEISADQYKDIYDKIYKPILYPFGGDDFSKLNTILRNILSSDEDISRGGLFDLINIIIGVDDAEDNTKIKKNFMLVTPEMRDKITLQCVKTTEKLVNILDKGAIDKFFYYIDTEAINSHDELQYVQWVLTNFKTFMIFLHMTMMDVYLLSRMFRKFDKTKSGSIEPHPDVENVIILAGELHCVSYANFLTSLGFNMVFFKESGTKCLDISQLPATIGEIKLHE
jgi:hypothetical protein